MLGFDANERMTSVERRTILAVDVRLEDGEQKERERPRLTLAPIVRIARGNRAFMYVQGKNAIRSLAYLSSGATLSPPFPFIFQGFFTHSFGDCDKRRRKPM